MQLQTPFINDGFTLDATLDARGPYRAVAFRYRPATAEEMFEYSYTKKETGKQRANAMVALLSKHVVSWDMETDKGDPIPVTADSLKRVPPQQLMQMIDFVTGYAEHEADAKN